MSHRYPDIPHGRVGYGMSSPNIPNDMGGCGMSYSTRYTLRSGRVWNVEPKRTQRSGRVLRAIPDAPPALRSVFPKLTHGRRVGYVAPESLPNRQVGVHIYQGFLFSGAYLGTPYIPNTTLESSGSLLIVNSLTGIRLHALPELANIRAHKCCYLHMIAGNAEFEHKRTKV